MESKPLSSGIKRICKANESLRAELLETLMDKVKKLLYITRYYTDQEFHLKKKFDGQIAAFQNLGYDVYYIGLDKRFLYLIHNDERTVYGKTHFRLPHYIHTQLYNDLHKAAIKAINKIGFDYVYWRYAPLWRSSCKVAESIKETGGKLLLEIPTFPPEKEAHLNALRKIYSVYAVHLSKCFDPLVDKYIVIGEDAHGEYKGKPAINIENGIDVSNIPVRKPINHKGTIHILALASMSYWHGYDRLIKSLAKYKGDQKVIIHMVGGNDGGCLPEWKELTHRLKLDDKVIFHGPMSGEPLEEMFNLCDVGVNSLAMFKKGFNVTMELKAREYIARGLPFICAVDDPALFYAEKPMWLKVANDESIPDMNEIIGFALKMKSDPSHVQILRKLAEEHMTWEQQYKKVFEQLEGVN